MIIRNRLAAIVYRSIALAGEIICMILVAHFAGASFVSYASYFPTLGGYIYMACLAMLIIFNAIDLKKGPKGIAAGIWMPFGLGVVWLAAITIAFYLFYMIPLGHTDYSVQDILLYLVMPAAYIADWALFEEKGTVKYGIIPFWIFFILVYLLFILVRPYVWNGEKLPGGTYYPYSFLDFDRWGVARVWAYICAALLICVVTAFLMVLLNDLVSGKFRKRIPEEEESK